MLALKSFMALLHQQLIRDDKLIEKFGIWLTSFLSDRKQFVQIPGGIRLVHMALYQVVYPREQC